MSLRYIIGIGLLALMLTGCRGGTSQATPTASPAATAVTTPPAASATPGSVTPSATRGVPDPGPRNAVYLIEGKPVQLTDGLSEVPAAPGSASKVITRYFGNDATGDLNRDGLADVAFVLTQTSGGSGTFFYAAAAMRTAAGWTGTNAVLLGDRIAPQSTHYEAGRVTFAYAERRPGEPMTTQPSQGVSRTFVIEDGRLTERR